METLFRMMLVRPAQQLPGDAPRLQLAQASALQDAWRAALARPQAEARGAMREVCMQFASTPRFIGRAEDHPLAGMLEALDRALGVLEAEGSLRTGAIARAIQASFGADAAHVAAREDFASALARLRDSILVIKSLAQPRTAALAALAVQLRAMELVARAAAGAPLPGDTAQLRRWRRQPIVLPAPAALAPALSAGAFEAGLARQRRERLQERQRRAAALLERHSRVKAALDELEALPPSCFLASPRVASDAVLPPQRLQLLQAADEEAAFATRLRALHLERLRTALEKERPLEIDREALAARTAAPRAPDELTPLPEALPGGRAPVLAGRSEFAPEQAPRAGFLLGPEALRSLAQPTRELLAQLRLEPAAMSVDRVASQLQSELGRLAAQLGTLAAELGALAGSPARRAFRRVGDALVSVATPSAPDWSTVDRGTADRGAADRATADQATADRGTADWGAAAVVGLLPMPPISHGGPDPVDVAAGSVAPAGVADLLVVKQQIVGYERADVAHIENVLKGERKLREHSRRAETVVVTLRESELATSDERELETADRFEMSRETSTTLKEDASVKAGLTVSGKYGPVVEFSASAEGGYAHTKEEATKTASSFAQDVTERSARRIAERVLERTQVTTTTETTEKNTHELDNVGGAGHVSGVYQWVNKVYQARMFNYGLRAMFDFMVPEPAAFLIAAMSRAQTAATTLAKPVEFVLTPGQITESNYGAWVQATGATDVAPPPEPYRTKSVDFRFGGGAPEALYNHSGQVTIDDGYRAVSGSIVVVRKIWAKDDVIDWALGQRYGRLHDAEWSARTALDDERDTIPFAVDAYHCAQAAFAVEVLTQRTERALQAWRLQTHAKLLAAHKAQVADYEEKLAALQMQAGPVAILGNNPAVNQRAIEAELRKNCVSILTQQHFDQFGAIATSALTGLPEIHLAQASVQGRCVRFFEHAFEWEHMAYVTYPYFWGRKDQWDERIAYDDPDPAFAEFLRAGFARVSVPVRPGFEGAVDHYLGFGEIWDGGPLPTVSSPTYLSIAEEIAERLDRPGTERAQGEPWAVRVPTNLVQLRPDDTLPAWRQDGAGGWVEA